MGFHITTLETGLQKIYEHYKQGLKKTYH